MGRGYGSDGTCRVCIFAAARTRRERMAGLAAEGQTSPAIAEALGTSPEVVRGTLWLHRSCVSSRTLRRSASGDKETDQPRAARSART